MFVHTFGAYFGLALSKVVYKRGVKDSDDEGSSYHGDMFAMIGQWGHDVRVVCLYAGGGPLGRG